MDEPGKAEEKSIGMMLADAGDGKATLTSLPLELKALADQL
jgi:hypothetical protein